MRYDTIYVQDIGTEEHPKARTGICRKGDIDERDRSYAMIIRSPDAEAIFALANKMDKFRQKVSSAVSELESPICIRGEVLNVDPVNMLCDELSAAMHSGNPAYAPPYEYATVRGTYGSRWCGGVIAG